MKNDLKKNIVKDKSKILEEQKRDFALYFVEDGDEGFSPEYNKHVIEKTIKKAEDLRKLKKKRYDETLRERSDAVATYLKSRVAEGNTPIEKYFGKREMANLRGQRILQEIEGRLRGRRTKFHLPGD